MTTTLVYPDASATIDATAVDIEVGSTRLDSAAVPYGSATLELPLLDDELLDWLDPRAGVRVPYECSVNGHYDIVPATYTPWVEQRRNLFDDPSGDNGTSTYWSGAPNVPVQVDGSAFGRTHAMRVANTVNGAQRGGAKIALATTTQYTVRVRARGNVERANWQFNYRPTGPALTTGQVQVATGVTVGAAVHEYEWTFTTTATAPNASVMLGFINASGTSVEWFEIVDFEVELGDTRGMGWIGQPRATETERVRFVGTANASDTVLETRAVDVPAHAVWVPENVRSFDLGLRSRRVDHKAKKVTLTLASDEALLMDYAALAIDTGARAHEASLRAVCDYVLAKIGAALEPSTADADVTAYWPVTNLITNSSFELGIAGWSNGSNARGLDRTNNRAFAGSYSAGWASLGAGPSFMSSVDRINITAGRSYVCTARVSSNVTPRNMRVMVRWHNSAGTIIAADSYGDYVLAPAAGFARATLVVSAPAGAAQASVHIEYAATAIDQFPFADMVMFYEGTEVIPEFNGDTPDTAQYIYAWAGAANVSASTRTPVVERLPELFTMKPGVKLWDFLLAITSSVGMVLWCDEQRRWFLELPEHRVIPTLVSVSEGNTSEGTDELSRDDEETFITGVVVHYEWTDDDGNRREAYDTAGTEEKVLTVELKHAYPGPGAASAILVRRQGSGRRQDVTTKTQQGTTPGMTAQIALPGAPATVGRVASVVFDHKTGFMELGAAGLVDLIPGSIAALVGTIDSLVGTIDSL